jgi:PPOX class probable F420-dependent enzyme
MAGPGPNETPTRQPAAAPGQRRVPAGTAAAKRRFGRARVARLATTTPAGRPHVVPCCFVLRGNTVYSAVDAKPKTTGALRRLQNVAANPDVSVLVDHYDEDWSELWWVRADGRARVLGPGRTTERALALLSEKYPQYGAVALTGPVISVRVTTWRHWP